MSRRDKRREGRGGQQGPGPEAAATPHLSSLPLQKGSVGTRLPRDTNGRLPPREPTTGEADYLFS